MTDPITAELDRQLNSEEAEAPKGKIAEMAARYDFEGPRLFGLPLKLDFAACDLATCDAWKRKCAGAPRGAFVLLRKIRSAAAHAFGDREHDPVTGPSSRPATVAPEQPNASHSQWVTEPWRSLACTIC
jgi:hypothetical protein